MTFDVSCTMSGGPAASVRAGSASAATRSTSAHWDARWEPRAGALAPLTPDGARGAIEVLTRAELQEQLERRGAFATQAQAAPAPAPAPATRAAPSLAAGPGRAGSISLHATATWDATGAGRATTMRP